jgi:hypothetical protein
MTIPKQMVACGECYCGCDDGPTKPGSFFHAGHDKRAESMLTRITYGNENSVAVRVVDAGYGPGGKNLTEEYKKMLAAEGGDRMDYFALQSLNEMVGKPGIAEAVVFLGKPGTPSAPSKTPGGHPQPEKSSILEIPLLGTVVAQGFAKSLTDAEKEIVQARFKGRPSMWLNSSA